MHARTAQVVGLRGSLFVIPPMHYAHHTCCSQLVVIEALNLTRAVVRIPVMGGHSEAVNIEFENDFQIEDIYTILNSAAGITVQDDIKNNVYPMPKFSEGKDDVFVGRIRKDISNPKSLDMWIVSDNLRKGAATNAIQIAEIVRNL